MIENQNRKSEETFSPLAKGHRLTDGVTYDDPSRDWFVVRAATRQDVQAPRTWNLGNAAINRLLWTPEGLTLVGWSDTQHLDAAGLDEFSA